MVSVDREWTKLLISLCTRVPESWWVSCTSNNLCSGYISGVDFTDNQEKFFVLQPDNEVHDDTIAAYAYNIDANYQ